jgi:hypothetical protein
MYPQSVRWVLIGMIQILLASCSAVSSSGLEISTMEFSYKVLVEADGSIRCQVEALHNDDGFLSLPIHFDGGDEVNCSDGRVDKKAVLIQNSNTYEAAGFQLADGTPFKFIFKRYTGTVYTTKVTMGSADITKPADQSTVKMGDPLELEFIPNDRANVRFVLNETFEAAALANAAGRYFLPASAIQQSGPRDLKMEYSKPFPLEGGLLGKGFYVHTTTSTVNFE